MQNLLTALAVFVLALVLGVLLSWVAKANHNVGETFPVQAQQAFLVKYQDNRMKVCFKSPVAVLNAPGTPLLCVPITETQIRKGGHLCFGSENEQTALLVCPTDPARSM